MDELRIRSPFMKRLLRTVIHKLIKKKLGKDIYTEVNDLKIRIDPDGEVVKAHVDLDLSFSTAVLFELVTKNL